MSSADTAEVGNGDLAQQAITALLTLRAELERDHGPETASQLLQVAIAAGREQVTFTQAEEMVAALCRGEWQEVARQLEASRTE